MYGCLWITPNGRTIVFTTRAGKNDEVHVVDWDGKNRRTIAKGFGHCVWAGPKTGTQWVYISVGRLVRILPDNSYRFFHMGETVGHRGVMMYDPGGTNKRAIWFKGMPGSKPRDDSWIPKWSSDVRFLTITSPSAGKRSEIFLGRFDDRFTRVVKWVRITDRPGQDAYAYAWIDAGLGQYRGELVLLGNRRDAGADPRLRPPRARVAAGDLCPPPGRRDARALPAHQDPGRRPVPLCEVPNSLRDCEARAANSSPAKTYSCETNPITP